MSFRCDRLSYAYGLHDVSFTLPQAGLVTIAGPNGAGKSTLMGILAGLKAPYRGSCMYLDQELRAWSRKKLAFRLAYLPQSMRVQFPFTAGEVVLMGRTPRSGGWSESPDDRKAAEHAMSITDTLAFRGRDYRALSGGEQQRVMLAAALAQEPETLLLDEPATHLDLRHQLDLYRMLRRLGQRMLVVAVSHDLNIALQFSDRVMVMDRGRLASDGKPEEALRPKLIEEVFGVRVGMEPGSGGRSWITYERDVVRAGSASEVNCAAS